MAKVRFIGDRPLLVPELGDRLVQPDEIYTVPDARFEAYMLHPDRWESIEEPAPVEEPPALPTKAATNKAATKTARTSDATAAAASTAQAADAAAPTTPAGAES